LFLRDWPCYITAMEYQSRYSAASGLHARDLCFIGHRWEAGVKFSTRASESWVVHNGPDGAQRIWGGAPWLTAVWYSPKQTAFVANARGSLYVLREVPEVPEPEDTDILVSFMGVWGIADDCVFAWGDKQDQSGAMFRWNGAEWREMPAPSFSVMSVHGLAPDFLYAGGYDGGLARFDGKAWQPIQVPTTETINQVFVAGEDEVYACASEIVLGGGRSAFEPAYKNEQLYFTGVAKWKGDLWLAAGGSPHRRRGGEVTQVEVPIAARSFEARENLIILADDLIGITANGEDYQAAGRNDWLLKDLRGEDPAWLD
jgi:hypothetical protein